MNPRAWPLLFLIFGSLPSAINAARPQDRSSARADLPAGVGPETLTNPLCAISGRVATPDGRPVSGAQVQVAIDGAVEEPQTLRTNLKGEFQAEYAPPGGNDPAALCAKVVVSKEGYVDARTMVKSASEVEASRLELVLREDEPDADVLPVSALVAGLLPRLRAHAEGVTEEAPTHLEFSQAIEGWLNGLDCLKAVTLLERVVEQDPTCFECRVLLGLALLETGAWTSAESQLSRAEALAASSASQQKRSELLLIRGLLAGWRKQQEKAAAFLREAVAAQPSDALLLQEVGRLSLLEKNWESAADYLKGAIEGGAASDAHLLRAQALLELGHPEEADVEMNAYLAGKQPSELPLTARLVRVLLRDRLRLQGYADAKLMTRESFEQLVQAVPELQGLNPARSQRMLTTVLRQVGRSVKTFFDQFQNTTSLEEIEEEILGPDSKVMRVRSEKFQYLMLNTPSKWGVGLTEYRTRPNSGGFLPAAQSGRVMRTVGFASTSLYFHPAYQPKADFRLLGSQAIQGRQALVVAFAQRPKNAPILRRFNARGESIPILVQGVAWIDSSTYTMLRVRTELLRLPPDLPLGRLSTQVNFDKVRFEEVAASCWVPRDVEVTVEWKGRLLRNRHLYSEYRLFKVETEEKQRIKSGPSTPVRLK